MYKLTATVNPQSSMPYVTTLCRDTEYSAIRFIPSGVEYDYEPMLFGTTDEAWRDMESIKSVAAIHRAFDGEPVIVRTEEA